MKEQVVLFGRLKSLLGIITEPHSASVNGCLPAIIILNAGLLHRIGPNRISVKIARQMALAGFLAFRFDFSGIGDSGMRDDDLPFEKSSINETQEAMNYLSSVRSINRYIIIGICSGANIAFKTAYKDHRVIGVIGINGSYFDNQDPLGLSRNFENRIQSRYYRKQLFNYKSWLRLITGKSNLHSIVGFLITKTKDFLYHSKDISCELNPSTKWNSLVERGVDLFLIYSEGSQAFDIFRLTLENHLNELKTNGKIRLEVIKNSDHIFTLLWSQNVLTDFVNKWLQSRQRNWATT